jgi:fructoselysine-6-P-deglycase FrlB-like protein
MALESIAQVSQPRKETPFASAFTAAQHPSTYILVFQWFADLCSNHLNHPQAGERASITQSAPVARKVS